MDDQLHYGMGVEYENPEDHPSGIKLYSYFSEKPAQHLNDNERVALAVHVALCDECAEIGSGIEEDDELLDALVLTAEDQEEVERFIAACEARLAQIQGETVNKESTTVQIWQEVKGFFEFFLGGMEVKPKPGMRTLSAGTSDSRQKTINLNKGTKSEYRPFARVEQRQERAILFVARENFSKARLLLNNQVVFEAEDWRVGEEKPIAADLIVKDPEAVVWIFKEGLVWQSLSGEGGQQ